MDNNMMMQFMQMLMQNQTMMNQMMMQLMAQPNPNPVQAAAPSMPSMPSASEVIAQSNAAATTSAKELADLKAEIESLKSQLAAAQSELSSTKEELEALSIKERNATFDNINLKMSIRKAEADLGMSWDDYMKQLDIITGEDYYDKNRRAFEDMGLTNQEKHDVVKAYMDDKKNAGQPIIIFETGKERPTNLSQVWEKINKRKEEENMNNLSPENQQLAEEASKKGNLSKSQIAGLLARNEFGF